MFSAFVRGVSFEFGAISGAMLFDFLGFLFGEFGFRGGLVFSGVEVRFFLAFFLFGFFVFGKFGIDGGVDFLDFCFVFFKIGATDESVGFGFIGSFLVLGFRQFERERCSLLIVQFAFIARASGIGSRGYGQFERRSFVPRRICTVSGKGSVLGYADIFVGGNGSGFGFGASIGEQPAGKSPGEAARHRAASRSGGRNRADGQITGRARSGVFEIRLRLVNFGLDDWRRRRSRGLATILGKRLAGKKNGFFGDGARGGRTGGFRRAMIEATLRGAARFETTGLATAIFLATIIATAVFVAA